MRQTTAGLLAPGSLDRAAFPKPKGSVADGAASPVTVAGAAAGSGKNPHRVPFSLLAKNRHIQSYAETTRAVKRAGAGEERVGLNIRFDPERPVASLARDVKWRLEAVTRRMFCGRLKLTH